MRQIALLALFLPLLPAYAGDRPLGSPSQRQLRSLSWQEQISEPDRKRLAGLWNAWTRALNQAADAGQAPRLAELGALVVADAAKPAPLPVPGEYRCRTVKIGVRESPRMQGMPALDVAAPHSCRITAKNGLFWFEQVSGQARLGGSLFADGDRMVFLGTKALEGEQGMRSYGSDATRNQVGVLQAFGDGRWRLELPWPHWQSNLELVEITPIGSQQPGDGG